MLWLTKLNLRLRALFQRRALDRQLNRELAFHLAEQTAEYLAQGMSPSEAELAARRLFGPVAALHEQCRDERRTRWLEDLMQDAQFALRSFAKSPAFTLVAVLTLALGIGANTAFFSAAYGIMFRPLPFPSPDRLIDLDDGIAGVGSVTALRALARAVDWAGYYPASELNLQLGGESSKITATAVTSNLLRVLQVAPARGRWFTAGEENFGQHRYAVLSDRAWRERFAEDPAILGQTITLNEEPFEIIGIMPANFAFPSANTELWVPIHMDARSLGYMWGDNDLWPIGRLREGMSLAAAQGELRPVIDRIRPMFPWRMPDAWGTGAQAVLHSKALVKDVQPKLFALSAASLLLLLIACGNVANLLLARAMRREREFAMRQALGAHWSRLIRQLLTENLVLVLIGGAVGLAVAAAILRALPLLLPKDTPRLAEIGPDPALVLAAVASMLLTVILFSVAPMLLLLRQRRESVAGRAVTASTRASRLSLALFGVELALATTLLIGAGLMGRTLWQLANVDSGIRAASLVAARISVGPSRCGKAEHCWATLENINRTLLENPVVRRVNWADNAPLDQNLSAVAVEIEDHPKPPGAPAYVLWRTEATPGYFPALGIRLRSGRLFTAADRPGAAPVIIISQATAQRFWPNESAIGKRIRTLSELQWRTVVGVVSDVAQYSLTGFPSWVDGVEYFSLAQKLPIDAGNIELTVFLESSQPQAPVTWQASLHQRFPDIVISHVKSLAAIRTDSVSNQRSTALLLGLFAVLGLLLGIAGVYGVISHRAQQRTREMGIRLALGASANQVVGMVLQETLLVSFLGAATGVLAAFGLSRFLSSLLFGVTARDVTTLTICPLVLLTAALLAAAVPAQRASRTDPALTFREE